MSKPTRSRLMGRIRGKDTGPERTIRSHLHRLGHRFRIHRNDLPGRPDLVFPRYRTVLFVHGCFWHRHPGCANAAVPKSRREFWQAKFDANVTRDRRAKERLEDMGWLVITAWECHIEKDPDEVARDISQLLKARGDV